MRNRIPRSLVFPVRGVLALGLIVLLHPLLGADPPDSDDPFAEANRATQTPAPAPAGKTKPDPLGDRVKLEASITPSEARPGTTVRLTLTGTLQPGYHTYALTRKTPTQEEATLSRLTYEDNPNAKPLPGVEESEPVRVTEEGVGSAYEYKGTFTWAQDLLIPPETPPGPVTVKGAVHLQVCNDRRCLQGVRPFEATVKVSGEAVPLTPDVTSRLQPQPGGTSATRGAPAPPARPSGLLGFILQGIFFGAVSLITPCVFPMIPITVSFFLKQSEKHHKNAVLLASVYSGTIVTVLTISGMFLIPILQPFSQHYVTNFCLGALFLFFALSLFGMYDIALPTGLANLTSSQEGRGGLVGTTFMALTFTIISFTCVAPFYGTFIALSAAAQSAGDWVQLFLGALAFSATFAAPFFLLALFPRLIRTLPRSGSWMNSVKVVMGFLEVAASLKFLRAAELNFSARTDYFTYDLVLGAYIALCFLCGLYLLNVYRLPHDHDTPHTLSVPRLLFALAFLSLGFYLLPALGKNADGESVRPNGEIFSWINSFLLPEAPAAGPDLPDERGPTRKEATGVGRSSERLRWSGSLSRGLAQAAEQQRLVFVDFTGLG